MRRIFELAPAFWQQTLQQEGSRPTDCVSPRPGCLGYIAAGWSPRTCSAECRRGRRNRLARRRRQHDVAAARDDERDRQRRRRSRPPEQVCLFVQAETCVEVGLAAVEPGVSRAGFRVELGKIIEETLENLDELVRVSRAGFRRQLQRLLGHAGRTRGEAWRTGAACHGPASPPNPLTFLKNHPDSLATTSRTGMEVRAGPGRHRGA